MTTFPVDDVSPNPLPTLPGHKPGAPFLQALGVKPERIEVEGHSLHPLDFSGYRTSGNSIHQLHGLIWSAHVAYADHLPLALSPDHIWLTILQGYAQHTTLQPEDVRRHFTDSPEPKEILVEFPFAKGDPKAPWGQAIKDFADGLAATIGPRKVELLAGDFSTTGSVEKLCHRAAMMEALSPFYQYRGYTLCGIPEITLLGTVDDWKQLHHRARALGDLGAPAAWVKQLDRACGTLARAAAQDVDFRFFQNFYKLQGGSGGPYVSGEINAFFPYVRDYRTGKISRLNTRDENHVGDYASGLSRVPITWDYLGQRFQMALYAGTTGVAFDTDGRVQPTLGWALSDETTLPAPKENDG